MVSETRNHQRISELIVQAKEVLGDQNADIMADILGVELDDDLKCCCPFHEEKTPSFKYNKDNYSFHCFGCGKSVDIIDCLMEIEGETFIGAVQRLLDYAGMSAEIPNTGVETDRSYKYPVPQNGDMTQVYDYLSKRGISKETVDHFRVTANCENGYTNIAFNFFDEANNLLMIKYRPAHSVDKSQTKTWVQPGSSVKHILFGMENVKNSGELLITEGEIDAMSWYEAGIRNVVSIPLGSQDLKWVEVCYDWLSEFDTIILAGDNDAPGRKFMKECAARLSSVNIKTITYPDEYVVRDDGGNVVKAIKTKDANGVLQTYGKQYLHDLAVQASEVPIDSVVHLNEIDEVNVYEMPGIYTGIGPLDDKLVRMTFSGVYLLTGAASSGKSTVLNGIVLNALDQGRKVFLYSGELETGMLSGWLNSVAAGPGNADLVTRYGYGGREDRYYKVKPDIVKAIKNYYSENLLIYRDDGSNEANVMLGEMEKCVRRKGVKVFVIDNLTTVDLSQLDDDKYEGQTKFMRSLTAFSRKYEVLVIVVAHPRKIQSGMEIGLNDVSGSLNLINLATRTLSLRRVTQKEKDNPEYKYRNYDLIVTVLKDRLGGETGDVPCHYDRVSRRIFTCPEEYLHRYNWDKSVDSPDLPYRWKDEIVGDENPFGG